MSPTNAAAYYQTWNKSYTSWFKNLVTAAKISTIGVSYTFVAINVPNSRKSVTSSVQSTTQGTYTVIFTYLTSEVLSLGIYYASYDIVVY